MKDKSLAPQVCAQLTEELGPVDMMSKWFSFHHTSYYEKEMGGPLFRRMFSFAQPIDQDALPDIKLKANEIESRFMKRGRRMVNIDPGYLVLERFVLATGKNFTHRIYLAKGIYADLTLLYFKDGYQTLPWTYPDYAEKELQDFLKAVRKKHHAWMQNNNNQFTANQDAAK